MGLSYSLYSNILTRFCASFAALSQSIQNVVILRLQERKANKNGNMEYKVAHFFLTYYLKWTIIHTKIYSNKGLIILSKTSCDLFTYVVQTI